MQLPKELQLEPVIAQVDKVLASMKCSSRRNCNSSSSPSKTRPTGLNEVQFPKELRRRPLVRPSMRCGLNEVQFPKKLQGQDLSDLHGREPTSMKCSSRRNCDPSALPCGGRYRSLNEVQFPKELRLDGAALGTVDGGGASMKCSSRRNCDCLTFSPLFPRMMPQ